MSLSESITKPLFCIDITENKNNDVINGEEFITLAAPTQKIEEYETKQESIEETVKKTHLPLWLIIIQYLSAFLFIVTVSSTIEVGLRAAMQNAPFLVMSGFLGGIVWGVLTLVAFIKKKKITSEEKLEEKLEELSNNSDTLYRDLGVPEDALNVDILVFRYKIKKGEIRPELISVLQTTPYINTPVKIYATENELNVADISNVYSFERSELKSISRVNKRIAIPSWNKDEPPTKGKYKPFKMSVNSGNIFLKPYYILNIERDGQCFGIYLPCYDLESFEGLTGLVAEIE